MQVDISTKRCFERGSKVLTNLGIAPCEPLGDNNVWNSLFEITDNTSDIVVLATKVCVCVCVFVCVRMHALGLAHACLLQGVEGSGN